MSDITSQIILYHDNQTELDKLVPCFTEANQELTTADDVKLEYSVVGSTIFKHFIAVDIQGGTSMDMQGMIDWLKSFQPTWLMIDSFYSQVGESERFYLKNGKKTTKKTLLKTIRSLSSEVDLYFALQNTEIEYIQQLISEDSLDLNLIIDGSPLLFHLLALGDLKILKQAIKQGADINFVSQQTKWFHIETKRDVSIFEAVKGMNLLSIAIQLKKKPVINFLIQSGIDVNAVDANGDTPLTIAVGGTYAEQTYKYVEPLVKAGANINYEAPSGYTPLFLWLENYFPATRIIKQADVLIQLGADIKHVSRNKMNALWAARGHDTKLVEYVRALGVTEEMVPDGYYDGLTEAEQLRRCISKHDISMFTQLYQTIQPNLKNQYSMLLGAISDGFFQAVKFLIENGFPAHYQDRDGLFPYQIAKGDYQQKEIADYLKEQMAGFTEESKKRVELARPFYDDFIAIFEKIEEDPEKYIEPVMRYFSQDFINQERVTPLAESLKTFWARQAVNTGKGKVTHKVDSDYNVTFSRPNRFSNTLEVKISTSDKIQVIELGTRY